MTYLAISTFRRYSIYMAFNIMHMRKPTLSFGSDLRSSNGTGQTSSAKPDCSKYFCHWHTPACPDDFRTGLITHDSSSLSHGVSRS